MAAAVARVAISLGSNLGDRAAHLGFAVSTLETHLRDLRVSRLRETTHLGVGTRPSYLNQAAVGLTALTPFDLLDLLLELERIRGRERPYAEAPRTLDLDLVLYEDRVIATERLAVPHPRFRDRPFVLEPLAEIAPDWVDPVTGLTVGELWTRKKGSGVFSNSAYLP